MEFKFRNDNEIKRKKMMVVSGIVFVSIVLFSVTFPFLLKCINGMKKSIAIELKNNKYEKTENKKVLTLSSIENKDDIDCINKVILVDRDNVYYYFFIREVYTGAFVIGEKIVFDVYKNRKNKQKLYLEKYDMWAKKINP